MLASGVAALAATFTTVLNRGDHAIFSDTAGALLSVDNTFNSPFNAWLINRGLVTLPLRMRQHNASAQAIAEHPHHAFAASQLARPDAGFGGVLTFGLNTDHDGHNRFVSKLNVITSAVSLGHDESLIVFLGEDDERQYLYPPGFHQGFFRLAVGLEDTDDLIRDIDHALS